jgi:hypothetical protein
MVLLAALGSAGETASIRRVQGAGERMAAGGISIRPHSRSRCPYWGFEATFASVLAELRVTLPTVAFLLDGDIEDTGLMRILACAASFCGDRLDRSRRDDALTSLAALLAIRQAGNHPTDPQRSNYINDLP